jgi:hypothetical protein
MKTITVRLPERLAAQLEAESRARKMSKSDIVRDRLASAPTAQTDSLDDIADVIGSVDGLPADLSRNIKRYLKAGYGRKRPR